MAPPFDLERFVQAQDPVIEQARRELEQGRKHSHWMWFVFPQLRGLGRSATAHHFAIASLAEAQAFIEHPALGPRLRECTELVLRLQERSIGQIFGSPDDMKFHSCVTLFSMVRDAAPVFHAALVKYFAGEPDRLTIELLATARRS
ncbi:MAG TPA: DUF1810 domain-containing protein [Steroidobacteraceae bacterium]